MMNREPAGSRFLPSDRRVKIIAFSLVEVTIAIAIASFAILAIIGVLPVGLRSSHESSQDTVLALATQQANAWSRSQPFASLAEAAGTSSNFMIYFNVDGTLARTNDGVPATVATTDAQYSCTISIYQSGVSANLLYLQYCFEWPLVAPASARQKFIVAASRSNED